jgi:hypothetical protein
MNFKFHHMNICTDNLSRLSKFYKTLFDLGTIADKEHTVVSGIREDRAYTGKVDFLTDGDIEEVCEPYGPWTLLLPNRRHQRVHAPLR